MYPDFSLPTGELISDSWFADFHNSGMWDPIGCLTRSSLEFPNAAVASSLSDVLEPNVHSRFSLSPKAAAGILRRANKRDRDLPPQLEKVLRLLASRMPPDASVEEKSPEPSEASGEARTTEPTKELSSPLEPLQMELF